MSDVWKLQLFVFDPHRLLCTPRRLTADEITLELIPPPPNTFDFLCEYHSALTHACLLVSYQGCVFLATAYVFKLVLFNPVLRAGCFKQQKDKFYVILTVHRR